MRTSRISATSLAFFAAALSLGCTDSIPDGLRRTPAGDGALVRYDVQHKPLPEIPLPNDMATWPDPTSRTGLRVNASLVAPTSIERTIREKFDQLEGWGTYAPINVSFDKKDPEDPRAAIDLANVAMRHQGDDYDFADDVMYVVNLKTGVPSPLDLGEGSFQYVTERKDKYWRNDTRRWESNLLWDTADETHDAVTGAFDPARTKDGTPTGSPIYKPEWDTDYDGVLDRPNLLDPNGCDTAAKMLADMAAAAGDPDPDLKRTQIEAARDRCLTDSLLSWYERETDTLTARPLIPLDEQTQYAVVITDRLKDADGHPVRSPFDFVYHPNQEAGISRLRDVLSDSTLASYYGDIGGKGLEHVSFAWVYTTEPILEDMRLIRDGLYGQGPFKRLSKQFPARADVAHSAGTVDLETLASGVEEPPDWKTSASCAPHPDAKGVMHGPALHPYMVDFAAQNVRDAIKTLASQGFGFSGPVLDEIIRSFDSISHIVVGTVDSPWFIEGGPDSLDPNASWNVNFTTGEAEIHTDQVNFLIAVPKASPGHAQPFPVAYYGHGYTGATAEMLGFAGRMAQQGIASVSINAVSHGLVLDPAPTQLGVSLFRGACEGPFASAFFSGRQKDWDGDGLGDSGGDYWTAYLFHTRDAVRQSAVDLLQTFRMLKGFDGSKLSHLDLDDNGQLDDKDGDFDADGKPDLGGPNVSYYSWGQSLGGILSPFLGALDPVVVAAAPSAGAGGLLDVGARTQNGGAFEGIYLRQFGPLIVSVPPAEVDAKSTVCTADQLSLRFIAVNTNTTAEVEFACLDKDKVPSGGTVVVRNRRNGEIRCGRVELDGRLRIGIPTNEGDKLEVAIYDQADAVDSYDHVHGCNLTVGEDHRAALFDTWGEGAVPDGAVNPITGDTVCTSATGCSHFAKHYFLKGEPLTAPTDGFGIIRQTPELRRLMSIAFNIIDAGDPVNFAPFYAIKPSIGPDGKPRPPTALLNLAGIGDQDVPLTAAISLARAAGAMPFLRPEAAQLYPALADYATPQALYDAWGNRTANRVMIDGNVLEGVQRLLRQSPAAGVCKWNQVPLGADVVCHPNCSQEGSNVGCNDNQVCSGGRCIERPLSARECAEYLFDPDDVDDGQATWGELEASVPLRVARIAEPALAAGNDLDALWAPRLMGVPGAADSAGWTANQRVLSTVMTYVKPRGNHGVEPNDPCEAWQIGRYYVNLVGRFFATDGADLYYLSHPTSHGCLARAPNQGGCNFVLDIK